MKPALLALPLLFLAAGCGGGGADDVGAMRGDTATNAPAAAAPPAVARGCPQSDWSGPWTACAEAKWVGRVASAAGYRIVGDTGSALVAEGRGHGFYIWTTRAGIVPPRDEIVAEEAWDELGSVRGLPIYGDQHLWRWWSTGDTIFWIQAGPSETSTVPDVAELDGLVAASLRLRPPS